MSQTCDELDINGFLTSGQLKNLLPKIMQPGSLTKSGATITLPQFKIKQKFDLKDSLSQVWKYYMFIDSSEFYLCPVSLSKVVNLMIVVFLPFFTFSGNLYLLQKCQGFFSSKDWCTLIRTKHSSVLLLRLVRINVHPSIYLPVFFSIMTTLIKQPCRNPVELFIFKSFHQHFIFFLIRCVT